MTKQVRVILDGVEAVARLHEDAAPQTVARFWAALPIEAVLRHVRWSGEAGYILISQLADKTQPLENAISFYPPGSIAFRAEHGETAFSYGQAQARDHAHVATWACHLGTLETNIDAFLAKVAADAERGRQADAPSARGGAVKRVEVEIDGVVAQTELNEAGAPRATAALCLAETREAAQANLAASLPNAKPTPATRRREGAEAMLIGTPAEIAARLRDYAAIGVTEICAIFYSPDAAGAVRQMQLFARDVIPAVT